MNQFIYKKETYNIIGTAMEVHKTLGMGLPQLYKPATLTAKYNSEHS